MIIKSEALTIRADMIDDFPDGIPHWLVREPMHRVYAVMALRQRAMDLLNDSPMPWIPPRHAVDPQHESNNPNDPDTIDDWDDWDD